MIDFVKIVDGHLQVIYENKELKKGVSGLMRVRDDAEFVAASIDSCIDALDELIIVYNDCTDDTPKIVKEKAKQYPGKIRVYEYPYKVYAVNLTKEEYDYITNEPLDSPHRLCNYYNFALSKVKYQHAVKIDADQIYFTEKLKYWCDAYRKKIKFTPRLVIGIPLVAWIVKNLKSKNKFDNNYLKLLQGSFFRDSYLESIRYYVSKSDINCLSLSGLNIININKEWFVPLGYVSDNFTLLSPYNGVGDHLIFKVNNNAFYYPAPIEMNESYTKQRSDSFTNIEVFNKTGHSLSVGTVWFHMNCMRQNVKSKIEFIYKNKPNRFIKLDDFQKSYYYSLRSKFDSSVVSNYKLFQLLFVYSNINYKKELVAMNKEIHKKSSK